MTEKDQASEKHISIFFLFLKWQMLIQSTEALNSIIGKL